MYSSPTNVLRVGEDLLKAFWKFLRFCFSSDQWKKHYIAKTLLTICGKFLFGSGCNYKSYKFSYKFAFIPLFPFVCYLVVTNYLFIASGDLLRRHFEFNRFLKRILLHVIPVRGNIDIARYLLLFLKEDFSKSK